jgi:hypothetical protein
MSYLAKHSIASGLVLIFSVVFFIESLNYPASASTLPQILIILIALLAIGMFIEAYIKNKKTDAMSHVKKEAEKINIKRVVVFAAMIALYIIFIDVIGFFILTPVFLFTALTYLRAAKVKTAILLSIGFTLLIYGLFSMFLNIPLPMGIFS